MFCDTCGNKMLKMQIKTRQRQTFSLYKIWKNNKQDWRPAAGNVTGCHPVHGEKEAGQQQAVIALKWKLWTGSCVALGNKLADLWIKPKISIQFLELLPPSISLLLYQFHFSPSLKAFWVYLQLTCVPTVFLQIHLSSSPPFPSPPSTFVWHPPPASSLLCLPTSLRSEAEQRCCLSIIE